MEEKHEDDVEIIHEQACSREEEFYLDPKTRLTVFTKIYLSKRPCCKTGCRHCPYDYKKQ